MILLIGFLLLVTILYLSAQNWRRSIKIVFFLVVFEGALRKWILPQASEMIYFLKDIVILGAYLQYYFLVPSQKKIKIDENNGVVQIIVFVAAGWCIFQAFNPSLGSPFVGILGLKSYLMYVPMMWMLPTLFTTEEELYKFLRIHLLLIIPTGLIGIIQFFSPPWSPINAYAPGIDQAIATFGFGATAAIRITGTFSYINSYTGYLIACFGLLIPFLTIKQTRWWKIATFVELFLVVLNMIMTGSRTPVIVAVLTLIGYFSSLFFINFSTIKNLLRRLFIPATIMVALSMFSFRSAFEQFERRVNNAGNDLYWRIAYTFKQPFDYFQYKALDGYGVGATHAGTAPLRAILRLPPGEYIPVGYEGEMGRIALEIGPIGFLLWYGLRISLAIALLSLSWKLKRPFLRNLALVACLVQLIQISGQMVFHHTFAVYYWFFSGFIFLLPQLDKIESQRQNLAAEPSHLS